MGFEGEVGILVDLFYPSYPPPPPPPPPSPFTCALRAQVATEWLFSLPEPVLAQQLAERGLTVSGARMGPPGGAAAAGGGQQAPAQREVVSALEPRRVPVTVSERESWVCEGGERMNICRDSSVEVEGAVSSLFPLFSLLGSETPNPQPRRACATSPPAIPTLVW